MGDFCMPSLGADMTEGTLTEWLVHPGDVVHRGDVIAVVDTVKSAIDIEVFEEGRVEELLVEPGTSVPVGTPLARLASVNGSVQPEPTEPEPTEPEPEPEPTEPQPEPEPTEPGPSTTVETTRPRPSSPPSPVLRHLAHDRGVDLSTVKGTGPDGIITRSDVEFTARPVRADRLHASPYARRRAGELEVDLATVHGTGPDGAVTVSDVEAAAGPASSPAPVRAPAPAPAPEAARTGGCGSRARGSDAQRDRRPDGALEAGDPALLPRDDDRPRCRHGVAGPLQCRPTVHGAGAPRGAHAQGGRDRRPRRPRDERVLRRRSLPAIDVGSPRCRGVAARRRTRRPGDPRHGPPERPRPDGGPQGPGGPSPRRTPSWIGDVRPDA